MNLFPAFIRENRWNRLGFWLGFLILPLLWGTWVWLDSDRKQQHRHWAAEVQSVLGGIYWTCKMYWDDHDPQDECRREDITGREYPFEPADRVKYQMKGNAITFRATARHLDDPQHTTWAIDADGNIHGGG